MTPTATVARLRRSVRPHSDLLSNSSSLIATSAVTSVLGFAFWWVAARTASQTAVGQASAAVSAMTFLGTIAMFGLGTLLISELPRMTSGRWRLISACVLASSLVGLVGDLVYVLLAMTVVPSLAIAPPFALVLLALGVLVTAGTLVLDEAMVGLMAGPVQLVRNLYFAGGKLAALVVLALAPVALNSSELLGVWVGAGALSVLAVAVSVRRRGIGGRMRPDFAKLHSVRRTAMDHNMLNLAMFLPQSALPLLVAIVVSARANAGFYAAWMIITVLAMIPGHFATALFAVARDPETLKAKVRVALLGSLAIGVPISLFVIVEREDIMGIFGSGYVGLGAAPLGILALAFIPIVFRQLYIAVSRATGRVRRATMVALVAGAVELSAAAIGGATGGVVRLSVALLCVLVLEALVMAPTVIRALRTGR